METREFNPQIDPSVDVMGEPASGFKHRLGQFGRKIKRIDVRHQIETHPFAAVGIGVAAGALIGFVRPKPQRGRITGALFATLGMIGFRLVREAAVTQLRDIAMQWLADARAIQEQDAGPQSSPIPSGAV